ncbi:unnamed protein product [Meloidogyne enterolobii]|uniref:Uncharacterized protein n=1 Tax=Meloidogyne enterolobii TaxID=390850 RepID=A0ACB0ZYS1_MELEN
MDLGPILRPGLGSTPKRLNPAPNPSLIPSLWSVAHAHLFFNKMASNWFASSSLRRVSFLHLFSSISSSPQFFLKKCLPPFVFPHLKTLQLIFACTTSIQKN